MAGELEDGEFLGLGFHFDGEGAGAPFSREVEGINVVVMALRLGSVPASQGTGQVEERFTVPRGNGLLGGSSNRQAIGQAAVMVHVIYQGHAGSGADGKEVSGSEGLVVVFESETGADGIRKALDGLGESAEGDGFVPIGTTAVQVERVSTHPISDFSLIVEFCEAMSECAGVGRI